MYQSILFGQLCSAKTSDFKLPVAHPLFWVPVETWSAHLSDQIAIVTDVKLIATFMRIVGASFTSVFWVVAQRSRWCGGILIWSRLRIWGGRFGGCRIFCQIKMPFKRNIRLNLLTYEALCIWLRWANRKLNDFCSSVSLQRSIAWSTPRQRIYLLKKGKLIFLRSFLRATCRTHCSCWDQPYIVPVRNSLEEPDFPVELLQVVATMVWKIVE